MMQMFLMEIIIFVTGKRNWRNDDEQIFFSSFNQRYDPQKSAASVSVTSLFCFAYLKR